MQALADEGKAAVQCGQLRLLDAEDTLARFSG
jgi:hypothetical protein